jgi:hypothetical protein
MSANPYAAGAKVYNGGSSAATSGTVDPMGYVERNLKQKAVKKVAVSQTRSGLAKAALKRVSAQKKAPAKRQPTAHEIHQNRLKNGTAAILQKPTVKASPTGKVVNKPGPARLPFDYELENQRIQGQTQLNDLLSQLGIEQTQGTQNFFSQTRELDRAQKQNLRDVLNNNVARGMGSSSSYLNDMTESQSQYNTLFSGISTAYNNMKNSVQARMSGGQKNFNDLDANLSRENANRTAARAMQGGSAPLQDYKKVKPTPVAKKEALLKMPGQKAKPTAAQIRANRRKQGR